MDMVRDGVSSRGDLWLSIRREAEPALAYDPIFGRSLLASILDHPDLGTAVSHQIGQRLGKSIGNRHQFERAANEAFAASPDLVDAASRDLEVIVLNDPASSGPLPVLLNFKGYVALRVSNWLWRQNRRDLALLLQSEIQGVSHPQEGRFAIVTDVGCGMRWTRRCQARPSAGVKSARRSAGDGDNKAWSPGRA